MLIRKKDLRKAWISLKLKLHLWLVYFLLLDLEDSASGLPHMQGVEKHIIHKAYLSQQKLQRHKHKETKVACCSQRKTFPSLQKVYQEWET